MAADGDNIAVQIARMEERFEALSGRLDKVTESVEALNRLAIQGRMAIIVLVALGSFVGWVLAQAESVRGLFLGKH